MPVLDCHKVFDLSTPHQSELQRRPAFSRTREVIACLLIELLNVLTSGLTFYFVVLAQTRQTVNDSYRFVNVIIDDIFVIILDQGGIEFQTSGFQSAAHFVLRHTSAFVKPLHPFHEAWRNTEDND